MKKLFNLPVSITIIQLISFAHLIYTHKYKAGQYPADLIELNIIAFLNSIVLGMSYVFYFKAGYKENFWVIPVSFALVPIMMVLIVYFVMFISVNS